MLGFLGFTLNNELHKTFADCFDFHTAIHSMVYHQTFILVSFYFMMFLLLFEFLTTLYAHLFLTIEGSSMCIIWNAIFELLGLNLFENFKFSRTKTLVLGSWK
jgi:hypothetical protein